MCMCPSCGCQVVKELLKEVLIRTPVTDKSELTLDPFNRKRLTACLRYVATDRELFEAYREELLSQLQTPSDLNSLSELPGAKAECATDEPDSVPYRRLFEEGLGVLSDVELVRLAASPAALHELGNCLADVGVTFESLYWLEPMKAAEDRSHVAEFGTTHREAGHAALVKGVEMGIYPDSVLASGSSSGQST